MRPYSNVDNERLALKGVITVALAVVVGLMPNALTIIPAVVASVGMWVTELIYATD